MNEPSRFKLTQLPKLLLQLTSLLLTTAGTFTLVATIFVIMLQILHFIESNSWVNFTPEILFDKCYCPLFTHDLIKKIGLSGMLFGSSVILLFSGYLTSLTSTKSVLITLKLNRITPNTEA